ncbi:MAG: hypothetical protein KBS81_05305, partial [Spirochaetales bacterium]|nr:hypothetical protein [Candidatus Physcosoma equi]
TGNRTVTFKGVDTRGLQVVNVGFSEGEPSMTGDSLFDRSAVSHSFANLGTAQEIKKELASPLNNSKLGFSVYLYYGLWSHHNISLQLGYSNFFGQTIIENNERPVIEIRCDVQNLTQGGWPDNAEIVSSTIDLSGAKIPNEVASQVLYGTEKKEIMSVADSDSFHWKTILNYTKKDVKKWGYMKLSFFSDIDLNYLNEAVSNVHKDVYYGFVTVKVLVGE